MEEYFIYLIIILIIISYYISKKVIEIKEIRNQNNKTRDKIKKINDEIISNKKQVEWLQQALSEMEKEKTIGFPWFAEAYAEVKTLIDDNRIKSLTYKSRPAYKAAEVVKEVKKEKRLLLTENKKLEYINKYYESIFPQLIDFRDEAIRDDLIRVSNSKSKENYNLDTVKNWITEGEYNSLSNIERNQKALDRYLKRKKSKLEIGLLYERYIGYIYELHGYTVNYYGIKKGLDDLGIDLICKKGNQTILIQCKCWSIHKEIHENVVNQLFGTTFKYCYDNAKKGITYTQFNQLLQDKRIIPIIYTSTKLSDRAKEFANVLNVEVKDEYPLKDYPMIKCNLGKSGEKIYHLPFDQQYDNIIMFKNKNTFYVSKVIQAESKGYRRAYRWKGEH